MQGLSSVVSLASDGNGWGSDGYCALLSSGGVECWGNNSRGELGDGISTGPDTCYSGACSTTPVAVKDLTSVVSLTGDQGGYCALLSSGDVECWGDNSSGDLGDGSSTGPDTCQGGFSCSTTPVGVKGLASVKNLASDYESQGFCALLTSGHVDCWGNNSFGELGDGTSTGPDCHGGCKRNAGRREGTCLRHEPRRK